MCTFGAWIASLLGGVWPWLITYGKLVPPVILGLSALWVLRCVIGSRWEERKLKQMIAKGETDTKDQQEKVTIWLELGTLVPVWAIAAVGLALVWSLLVGLRALLVTACGS